MKILVINSGSSSIKYQLFDMTGPSSLTVGLVERIGQPMGRINHTAFLERGEQKVSRDIAIKDHREGLAQVAQLLLDAEVGVITSPSEVAAVGHRVVHGGEAFSQTTLITAAVKAKIRELTVRKHNMDAEVIKRLNRVIRGTANYFATSFSTSRWEFQKLDSWIRMRLRSMKLKRKNYSDNGKLRVRYFRHKLGLLTLEGFCKGCDAHGQAHRVAPRYGATSIGVAR